jgi:hypothetical protein
MSVKGVGEECFEIRRFGFRPPETAAPLGWTTITGKTRKRRMRSYDKREQFSSTKVSPVSPIYHLTNHTSSCTPYTINFCFLKGGKTMGKLCESLCRVGHRVCGFAMGSAQPARAEDTDQNRGQQLLTGGFSSMPSISKKASN